MNTEHGYGGKGGLNHYHESTEREEWNGSVRFYEYKHAEGVENVKPNDCLLEHVRITQETLKEVQRRLCLVKFCWSEVDLKKCVHLSTLPTSYYTVGNKERLLLWYADNFRRQFRALYKDRKPLLMGCDNECGVQRFVSTTIKRSTLPYPELYSWQGCAKFVSDYIEYVPLDNPLIMPSHLHTPTWLLEFQNGNSFECATLLVSLLLGQGYNAFVVSGYASREQSQCDTTMRSYSHLSNEQQPTKPRGSVGNTKYRLKSVPDFTSRFLLEMEARDKRKLDAEIQRKEEERKKMILEHEQPIPDEYQGHRIHAWVLVLPNESRVREQEVLQPFFIESSLGVSYEPTDPGTQCLYLGVESIWNDQNYWVNMQPRMVGCAQINWDLSKIQYWEHLLPGVPWTVQDVGQTVLDEDITTEQEKHLDMPLSYVNEITISSRQFKRRYPNGKKTVLYKKAKVELFAPYVQMDGLTERITLYNDYECITSVQIFEKYANREDRLVESHKKLDEDCIIDFYERGRADGCKLHYFLASQNDADESKRVIEFYDAVRQDGLSRIEMYTSYLEQCYNGREDLLYYREDQQQDGTYYRKIRNIIEKYLRNENIPANKDVAIKEYNIRNVIRLKYHYEKNRSTRNTRIFTRPSLADGGDNLLSNSEMTQQYSSDVSTQPERSLNLFYELGKLSREEEQSISQVREAESEIASFTKKRLYERLMPTLLVSLFDRNTIVEGASVKDEIRCMHSQQAVIEDVDYLGPYKARIGNPKSVSKAEAFVLRQECVDDFKQLLVNRANNILHKFEECQQELARIQMLLTQSEDLTREEEEQILAKTNELNFLLHTLETRLNRHKDLAPERYKTLVEFLRDHEHLAHTDVY